MHVWAIDGRKVNSVAGRCGPESPNQLSCELRITSEAKADLRPRLYKLEILHASTLSFAFWLSVLPGVGMMTTLSTYPQVTADDTISVSVHVGSDWNAESCMVIAHEQQGPSVVARIAAGRQLVQRHAALASAIMQPKTGPMCGRASPARTSWLWTSTESPPNEPFIRLEHGWEAAAPCLSSNSNDSAELSDADVLLLLRTTYNAGSFIVPGPLPLGHVGELFCLRRPSWLHYGVHLAWTNQDAAAPALQHRQWVLKVSAASGSDTIYRSTLPKDIASTRPSSGNSSITAHVVLTATPSQGWMALAPAETNSDRFRLSLAASWTRVNSKTPDWPMRLNVSGLGFQTDGTCDGFRTQCTHDRLRGRPRPGVRKVKNVLQKQSSGSIRCPHRHKFTHRFKIATPLSQPVYWVVYSFVRTFVLTGVLGRVFLCLNLCPKRCCIPCLYALLFQVRFGTAPA